MRIMSLARTGALLVTLMGACWGCSMFAASNQELAAVASKEEPAPAAGPVASGERVLYPIYRDNPGCFQRTRPWGNDIFALTLSGGGSRAAVFGAAVMLELQDMGVLDSVDLVSSVSGGSVAAALYALSRDPSQAEVPGDPKRIVWDRAHVIEMTRENLLYPWLWRWARPDSVAKFWFTAYDRTDIFADMLNAQLLTGLGAKDGYPTFKDLNPDRGTLILNATNFTAGHYKPDFTFTPWHFKTELNSDICSYEVARAVAASAAFPGVLQYSTLRHFTSAGEPDSYVHLMDGGASDNLGLNGLNQTMEALRLCGQKNEGENQESPPPPDHPCDKVLVLVVDAQNGFQGRKPSEADPRGPLDHFFDTNFLDAYDTLMRSGYGHILHEFRQDIEGKATDQAQDYEVLDLPLLSLVNDERWLGYDGQYGAWEACPVSLAGAGAAAGTDQFAARRACELQLRARAQVTEIQPGLGQKLRAIHTDWRIEPDQVACLEVAAHALVEAARPQLQEFFGAKLNETAETIEANSNLFETNQRKCSQPPPASS